MSSHHQNSFSEVLGPCGAEGLPPEEIRLIGAQPLDTLWKHARPVGCRGWTRWWTWRCFASGMASPAVRRAPNCIPEPRDLVFLLSVCLLLPDRPRQTPKSAGEGAFPLFSMPARYLTDTRRITTA